MEAEALTNRYDDIIDLPHWQSTTRPRMSRLNRAAQFAPFAALTGHDAAVQETGRLTDSFKELDESRKAELDAKLRYLMDHLHEEPHVKITFFQSDARKEGGAYIGTAGMVRKIDEFEKVVVLQDRRAIPIEKIFEIEMKPS